MSELGVKIFSLFDTSDYGLIGIGFVKGLRDAGVRVHWVPLKRVDAQRVAPMAPDEVQAAVASLQPLTLVDDLAAWVQSTAAPVNAEAVFLCIEPEHWPALVEGGKRHAGYVLWETDRLPTHWVRHLALVDAVCVPSRFVADAVQRCAPELPWFRLPPIYAAGPVEALADASASLRSALDLDEASFIFYSIGPWLPQHNQRDLVRAFVHAFDARDPVTLVLNTSAQGLGVPPRYSKSSTDALLQAQLDGLAEEKGEELPAICLVPYALNGLAMEALHHLGDCYVSLSHGAAWDMMAYLAALHGNPVVMTGWGGHGDFLGDGWPGALGYRLQPTPVWPPQAPLNWPDQCWALPSLDDAVARLREVVRSRDDWVAQARHAASRIGATYPQAALAADLLEVLRAVSATGGPGLRPEGPGIPRHGGSTPPGSPAGSRQDTRAAAAAAE